MTPRLKHWRMAALAVALIVIVAPVAAQDTLTIPRQAGVARDAGGPPIMGPQSKRPFTPPPSQDNTRIIPVIPPNAQVLVLPQASTDFLGKWGGHLALAYKSGVVKPPGDAIMSLMFGKRGGQVVLATTVFGSANSQVLETKAESEGPRAVKIVLKGLDLSTQPAVQHTEKIHIELERSDLVRCRKTVTLYVPGPGQIMEAEYEGELRPLTAREDRLLTEEVLRSGSLPRAQIEEGNPAPQ